MRTGIVVGVHADAEPGRLVGGGADGIALLPDRPDAALSAALTTEPTLTNLPQWTGEPLGPSACFNRLASRSDAAVVVLVESGTLLAPGCLSLLVEALAHPGRGLASPSTNHSWNERSVFSGAAASGVARTAAVARQKFGSAVRSLELSLAGFWIAVGRPVIEAIGGANEEHGIGPYWEMDYNIRAARAGFQGVWVGAAYAYCHQLTERRRAAEVHQMEGARHLYRDRFCGLRLRQQRADYETHCHGETCEYFAPVNLLTSRRPLGKAPPTTAGPPTEPATRQGPPPAARSTAAAPAGLRALDALGIFVYVRHGANTWPIVCGLTGETAGWEPAPEPDLPPEARAFCSAHCAPERSPTPLVSCVMPTFDRRSFVPQSVSYFLRQDYPAKELVIVDDSPEPVNDLLPADPRIVYHRLEARTVLGAKRNVACDRARGSIIIHWDDDDWASPDRVSVQVAALTRSGADICGTGSLLFYEPASSSAWRFTWPDGRRPWVAGTSLCFRKELWARFPFPDVATGEDTEFVFNPAVREVADVRAAGCIVAIIHRRNTEPKCVHDPCWSPRPSREAEDLLGDDIAFYHRLTRQTHGRNDSFVGESRATGT